MQPKHSRRSARLNLAVVTSGWYWQTDQLKVIKTTNAVKLLVNDQVPLLTCNVWEHAYYLDCQNRRPDFLQAFLDQLVNWDFVAQQFAKAKLVAVGL